MLLSMETLSVLFLTMSLNYGLPDGLLSSLCYIESSHRTQAIAYNDGKTHSYGVCQVKRTACLQVGLDYSEADLMDPKKNVECSAKYLSYQIKRYNGNIARGVTAYNKGHSSGDGNSVYYKKVSKKWGVQCQTLAKQ